MKVGIIDTHTHLCDKTFDNDLDQVIGQAIEKGVCGCLLLTETIADIPKALEIKKRYPQWVNLCFGIHPIQTFNEGFRSVSMKDIKHINETITLHKDKLVGIGEIGLDFTPTLCPSNDIQEVQKKAFITQLQIAKRLNLPVNIHSRSAAKQTLEVLKTEGMKHVQMHAFDGRPSLALTGIAEGYYFSIPTSVLRNKQKQELVKELPLDHLLIETDSPVLAVQTDERNVPSEAVKVCKFIAETKGLDLDTVIQITSENAQKLYGPLMLNNSISV